MGDLPPSYRGLEGFGLPDANGGVVPAPQRQSTAADMERAIANSKATLEQEKQNAERLVQALAISRAEEQRKKEADELAQALALSAATSAPPMLARQGTFEEELNRALAASREEAKQKAQAIASANIDQLRLAMALSRSKEQWSPPTTWAKGVGTAFEELVGGAWKPITHPDIIDQLGRLCAVNPITEVEYEVDGRTLTATMRDDGLVLQNDATTGQTTVVRLAPFFFEYRESGTTWKPITEPESLTALTAVLASSKARSYAVATDMGRQDYEASLANEQGLIFQTNVSTGTMRELRVSPIGSGGKPHFEYLADEVDWKPGLSNWEPIGSEEVCNIMAACAGGRGDGYFTSSAGHPMSVKLGEDGFMEQTNLATQTKRPLRPAPWLGHGAPVRVVDPTDGWVPGNLPIAQPVDPQLAQHIGAPIIDGQVVVPGQAMALTPAMNFYQPAAVPMGSPAQPISVAQPMGQPPMGMGMAQPGSIPQAPIAYYYSPQGDEVVPMGTVLQ